MALFLPSFDIRRPRGTLYQNMQIQLICYEEYCLEENEIIWYNNRLLHTAPMYTHNVLSGGELGELDTRRRPRRVRQGSLSMDFPTEAEAIRAHTLPSSYSGEREKDVKLRLSPSRCLSSSKSMLLKSMAERLLGKLRVVVGESL